MKIKQLVSYIAPILAALSSVWLMFWLDWKCEHAWECPDPWWWIPAVITCIAFIVTCVALFIIAVDKDCS